MANFFNLLLPIFIAKMRQFNMNQAINHRKYSMHSCKPIMLKNFLGTQKTISIDW